MLLDAHKLRGTSDRPEVRKEGRPTSGCRSRSGQARPGQLGTLSSGSAFSICQSAGEGPREEGPLAGSIFATPPDENRLVWCHVSHASWRHAERVGVATCDTRQRLRATAQVISPHGALPHVAQALRPRSRRAQRSPDLLPVSQADRCGGALRSVGAASEKKTCQRSVFVHVRIGQAQPAAEPFTLYSFSLCVSVVAHMCDCSFAAQVLVAEFAERVAGWEKEVALSARAV